MIAVEVSGAKEMQDLLHGMPPKLMGAVWADVEEGGLNVERGAKQRCPVSKATIVVNGQRYSGGRLRSSIHVIREREKRRISVGTNVLYGPYVEYGTGVYGPKGSPITIEPRTKRYLSWIGPDGGRRYAKRVTVQGMRAQPFLNPALEAERGPLLERVEATIATVLGGKQQ